MPLSLFGKPKQEIQRPPTTSVQETIMNIAKIKAEKEKQCVLSGDDAANRRWCC